MASRQFEVHLIFRFRFPDSTAVASDCQEEIRTSETPTAFISSYNTIRILAQKYCHYKTHSLHSAPIYKSFYFQYGLARYSKTANNLFANPPNIMRILGAL